MVFATRRMAETRRQYRSGSDERCRSRAWWGVGNAKGQIIGLDNYGLDTYTECNIIFGATIYCKLPRLFRDNFCSEVEIYEQLPCLLKKYPRRLSRAVYRSTPTNDDQTDRSVSVLGGLQFPRLVLGENIA